jgi:ferric-dicitrate binding protein FerR (iron transport regulator)
MAADGNTATVSVNRGWAEVHTEGAPVILHAGQSAHLDAGPQGGEKVAGKINRVIPQGVIQRQGQVQELPLQLDEVINWNDLVRTLQVGRAQITLLDGSVLNVGARSTIKIIKHDPQTQQTQIEMAVGRVQANVQKITAPGGKFELTTKSAVIGTIDTAFVAETDDQRTRVCGLEGVTVVKSSDPNIHKEVKLRKKQCTVVIFGEAPTDPVFDTGEFSSLVESTSIGEVGLSTAALAALIAGLGAAVGGTIAGVVLSTGTPISRTTP